MAIATLTLVFMNPNVFQRNVKIRKAEAASLIMRSTNPRDVAYIFRDYTRKIHAKSNPADPNFLRISVSCGQIEQWCEHNYPSFISVAPSGRGQQIDPMDRRSKVVELDQKRDQYLINEKRVKDARAKGVSVAEHQEQAQGGMPWEIFAFMSAIIVAIVSLSMGIAWVVIKFSVDE
jgi:farnesyl-diphosphate farnesyltransferase